VGDLHRDVLEACLSQQLLVLVFLKSPRNTPDQASILLTSSSGSLPLSPRNTMSETANRPPGLSTRKASEMTLGLSVERLMTQLEITTST
jgi:hypothetical protein